MPTSLNDERLRLRSGCSVWSASEPVSYPTPMERGEIVHADIVIVGAGITGAFLAERFTREGRSVAVVDRHAPATGSTLASTAMLLWELDASLLELEERFGFARAGRIAGICRQQVAGIAGMVKQFGIACDFAWRPSLYLSGNKLDREQLREEKRLRDRLGLEGQYLDAEALDACGIIGEGALLHQGSAEADPVKLALGLLAVAVMRGARVITPAKALGYETTLEGVVVETDCGVVRAGSLVLASGYEMPDFVPADRHRLASSWALASAPLERPPWPNGALIWEASEPYLYMRTAADGRVIVGGEDESVATASRREELTGQKVERLLAVAAARCPAIAGLRPQFAWSGYFGETEDSLPLIGQVPGRPNCFAAYGYGGNGMTFSALAADLLAAELSGVPSADAALFDLNRES
jgi:glycine/D-amino acid oxidase-like deaminating enzyme